MSRIIKLTQSFSGRSVRFEAAGIRSIKDYVSGPDAWGIARTPGMPHSDFPVAWIEYPIPPREGARSGTHFFSVLQSGQEVRAAMAGGTTDLHAWPDARMKLKEYLLDLQRTGHEQIDIYPLFGTSDARPAWGREPLKAMPVGSLIANLEAGRPLGYAGIGPMPSGSLSLPGPA